MKYKLLEDIKDGSAESIETRIVAIYYELTKNKFEDPRLICNRNDTIGSTKHGWSIPLWSIVGLRGGFITAEKIYYAFVVYLKWATPGGRKSIAKALNYLRGQKIIRMKPGIRLSKETMERMRQLESK